MTGMVSVTYGNRFSLVFWQWVIKLILVGRLILPILWSLFNFGMEINVVRLQIWGIVLVSRAIFYMFERYLMASCPKCLRYMIFMPSRPVELLFVLL